MWDPEKAKRRAAERSGLNDEELAEAERTAEHANNGPIGAQIREIFESKILMGSAMQSMDLTHQNFQDAFLALKGMDDNAVTKGVCLGLVMNNVMILRVLGQSSVDILDLTSRAVELASLFEDSAIETLGRNPFKVRDADGEN